MWIFLHDAFLSIVEPQPKIIGAAHLMVRARVRGDIERVFPGVEVIEGGGTDYPFRSILPRGHIAEALVQRLMGIDYNNFKNSVEGAHRHDAYLDVWAASIKLED